MIKKIKKVKDPAYNIVKIKIEIKGGVVNVVRKDKGARLEIVDLDNQSGDKSEFVFPSYVFVKNR